MDCPACHHGEKCLKIEVLSCFTIKNSEGIFSFQIKLLLTVLRHLCIHR